MFSKNKVRLGKNLINRATAYAAKAGYASVEEFITYLVEREINKSEPPDESEEIMEKRLKGLGYIS